MAAIWWRLSFDESLLFGIRKEFTYPEIDPIYRFIYHFFLRFQPTLSMNPHQCRKEEKSSINYHYNKRLRCE